MSAPQSRILAARYLACLQGEPLTLLLLLAQAPLIGWLCAVVWGSLQEDTPSLYFVMVLSCVWFGCINACREIVKERPIIERERLFGLSLPAYVWSKYSVLAVLGLIQALMLQFAIEWTLALRGAFLLQTLALWQASLCGTAMGLLISALMRSQDRAVAVVPLLIIPQILFSEFVIPREQFSSLMSIVEKIMPTYWGYEIFAQTAALEPDWWWLLWCVVVLFLLSTALLGVTLLLMQPKQMNH